MGILSVVGHHPMKATYTKEVIERRIGRIIPLSEMRDGEFGIIIEWANTIPYIGWRVVRRGKHLRQFQIGPTVESGGWDPWRESGMISEYFNNTTFKIKLIREGDHHAG